ncbi:Tetratricopeptide repeat-containing protein [Pseudomonas syringae pv. primulae]|uniref:Tetratricopeptide repeat-containing protein n=1 Tax=Pseudomonas syringae pv. primulae TaxID=251707 RepID=A0A3M3Y0N6_9PSED|nr:Tetratricopeptide repeat-containing protein [Pseudomonas syringae pv. primulae]
MVELGNRGFQVNKWWIPALTTLALLNGCASVERGSIPVVDSSSKVSNSERAAASRNGTYRSTAPVQQQPQAVPQDNGVVVMVPGAAGAGAGAGAGESFSAPASQAPFSVNTPPVDAAPVNQAPINPAPVNNSYSMPAASAPTGIPSSGGGLSEDEQLDGPVLALLTTAQQQQSSGDLNGASSSLERAQRVAPREPQVLYRLAQVRLAQGDAAQAEQLARRGLTYANGRASLQASLWGLIAQSREKQGDAAGAALARQKAR